MFILKCVRVRVLVRECIYGHWSVIYWHYNWLTLLYTHKHKFTAISSISQSPSHSLPRPTKIITHFGNIEVLKCQKCDSIVCHIQTRSEQREILTIAGGVMCKNREQLSTNEFKSTFKITWKLQMHTNTRTFRVCALERERKAILLLIAYAHRMSMCSKQTSPFHGNAHRPNQIILNNWIFMILWPFESFASFVPFRSFCITFSLHSLNVPHTMLITRVKLWLQKTLNATTWRQHHHTDAGDERPMWWRKSGCKEPSL